MVINLQVGVRSVCLLATHMVRKDGSCLTLKQKRFFSLEMLNSLRPNIFFLLMLLPKKDVPPKNWSCEEIIDYVTDGVEETDHTGGIEENGDMTMNDRGGEPNARFNK